MSTRSKRTILFLSLLALGVAGLSAKRLWRAEASLPRAEAGVTRVSPALQLPDFRLQAASGKSFARDDLAGQWSLLFFGYTHCPDVCPTTLKSLQAVTAQLRARGRPVRVVFVTLDPARDTPDKLRDYLGYFDPAFIGLGGDAAELSRLREALGVYAARTEAHSAAGYLLSHTDRLFLLNPQGDVVALFAERSDSRRLVQTIVALMQAG